MNLNIKNKYYKYFFVFLIFLFTFVDFITKKITINTIGFGCKLLLPFFSLCGGLNKGVSFGFLSSLDASLYISIAVFAIVSVLIVLFFKSKSIYESFAYALIISGANGNLLDRIVNHSVYDFLSFCAFDACFPSFNFADICITIGGATLFLLSFFTEKLNTKYDV